MKRLPLPVTLFLLTIMTPPETTFMAGSLALSPHRVLLILALVPAAVKVFSGRAGGVCLMDFLMAFHVAWAFIAVTQHHGLGQAMESSGIYIAEALGSYLVARAYVRDMPTFRDTSVVLVGCVLLMLLVAAPEAFTGRNWVRDPLGFNRGRMDSRFGMQRAFGTFQHPILYGLFSASAIGFSWFVLRSGELWGIPKVIRTGLALAATIFSVSTGALMCAVVQAVMIAWDWMLKRRRNRWLLLLLATAALWVLVDFMSNRDPMSVFIHYLSFNPATGYNRRVIWDHGKIDVINNPMLGIGFNVWSKPVWMHSDSMDNFWLLTAVRFGLPAVGSLLLTLLIGVRAAARDIPGEDPISANARAGWLVSVVAFSLAAFTVHLWNNSLTFYCFLLGLIGWAVVQPRAKAGSRRVTHRSEPKAAAPMTRRRVIARPVEPSAPRPSTPPDAVG